MRRPHGQTNVLSSFKVTSVRHFETFVYHDLLDAGVTPSLSVAGRIAW